MKGVFVEDENAREVDVWVIVLWILGIIVMVLVENWLQSTLNKQNTILQYIRLNNIHPITAKVSNYWIEEDKSLDTSDLLMTQDEYLIVTLQNKKSVKFPYSTSRNVFDNGSILSIENNLSPKETPYITYYPLNLASPALANLHLSSDEYETELHLSTNALIAVHDTPTTPKY